MKVEGGGRVHHDLESLVLTCGPFREKVRTGPGWAGATGVQPMSKEVFPEPLRRLTVVLRSRDVASHSRLLSLVLRICPSGPPRAVAGFAVDDSAVVLPRLQDLPGL